MEIGNISGFTGINSVYGKNKPNSANSGKDRFNVGSNVSDNGTKAKNNIDTFTFDKILNFNLSTKSYADDAEANTRRLEAVKARYGGENAAVDSSDVARAILGY